MAAAELTMELAIDGLSRLHSLVYRLMPRDSGTGECLSAVPGQVAAELVPLVSIHDKSQASALFIEEPQKTTEYRPVPSIGVYRQWTATDGSAKYRAPLILLTNSAAVDLQDVGYRKRIIDPGNCHCTLIYEQLLQKTALPPGASAKLYSLKDAENNNTAWQISGVYKELDPLLTLSKCSTPVAYPLANEAVQELCGGYILPPSQHIANASGQTEFYLSMCRLLFGKAGDPASARPFFVIEPKDSGRVSNGHMLIRNGKTCSSYFNLSTPLPTKVSDMFVNYMRLPSTDDIGVARSSLTGNGVADGGNDVKASAVCMGMSFPISIDTYYKAMDPLKGTRLDAHLENFKKVVRNTMRAFLVFVGKYNDTFNVNSPLQGIFNAYGKVKPQEDPLENITKCVDALTDLYTYTGAFFSDPSEQLTDGGSYIDERSQFSEQPIGDGTQSKYLRVYAFLPPRARLEVFAAEFKYELCILGHLVRVLTIGDALPRGFPPLPSSWLSYSVLKANSEEYLKQLGEYAKEFVASLGELPQPFLATDQAELARAKVLSRVNWLGVNGPAIAYDAEMAELKKNRQQLDNTVAMLKQVLVAVQKGTQAQLKTIMESQLKNSVKTLTDAVDNIRNDMQTLKSRSNNMAGASMTHGTSTPRPLALGSPNTSDAMQLIVADDDFADEGPPATENRAGEAASGLISNLRANLAKHGEQQGKIQSLEAGLSVIDRAGGMSGSSPVASPSQSIAEEDDDRELIENASAVVLAEEVEQQGGDSQKNRRQVADDSLDKGPLQPTSDEEIDDADPNEDEDDPYLAIKLPVGLDGRNVDKTLYRKQYNQARQGLTLDPLCVDLYVRQILSSHSLADEIVFVSPMSRLMEFFMAGNDEKVSDQLRELGKEKKPVLVIFPIKTTKNRDIDTLYRYELVGFDVDGKGYNCHLEIDYLSVQWEASAWKGLARQFGEMLGNRGPIYTLPVDSEALGDFTRLRKNKDPVFTEARAAFYILELLSRLFEALSPDKEGYQPTASNKNKATWKELGDKLPAAITCDSVTKKVGEYLRSKKTEYDEAVALDEDPIVFNLARDDDIESSSLQIHEREEELCLEALDEGNTAGITPPIARTYLVYLTRVLKYGVKSIRESSYVLPQLNIDGSESEEKIVRVCNQLREKMMDDNTSALCYIFLPILYGTDREKMATKFAGYNVGTVDEDGENIAIPLRWELVVFGYQQIGGSKESNRKKPLLPLRIIKFLTTTNEPAGRLRDELVSVYSRNLYPHPSGVLERSYRRVTPGDHDDYEISQTFAFICLKASQLMYHSVANKLSLLAKGNGPEEFGKVLDTVISSEHHTLKEEAEQFKLFLKKHNVRSEKLKSAISATQEQVDKIIHKSKERSEPVNFSVTEWGVTFDAAQYRSAFNWTVSGRSLTPEMVYIYAKTLRRRENKGKSSSTLLVLRTNIHAELNLPLGGTVEKAAERCLRNPKGKLNDVRKYKFIVLPRIDKITDDSGNTYHKHRMYIVYNYGNYCRFFKKSECLIFEIDPTYDRVTWSKVENQMHAEQATKEAQEAQEDQEEEAEEEEEDPMPIEESAAATAKRVTSRKKTNRLLNPQLKLDTVWEKAYKTVHDFEVVQILATLKVLGKYIDNSERANTDPVPVPLRPPNAILNPSEMDARVTLLSLAPVNLFVKAGEPISDDKIQEFAVDNSDLNMFRFYSNLVKSIAKISAVVKDWKTVGAKNFVINKSEEAKATRLDGMRQILGMLYGPEEVKFDRLKTMKTIRAGIFNPLRSKALAPPADKASASAAPMGEAEPAPMDVVPPEQPATIVPPPQSPIGPPQTVSAPDGDKGGDFWDDMPDF